MNDDMTNSSPEEIENVALYNLKKALARSEAAFDYGMEEIKKLTERIDAEVRSNRTTMTDIKQLREAIKVLESQ